MKLIPLHDGLNASGALLMGFSLFGFLGNVMIDFNWGSNPITDSIAVAYWMTLRWMIPFPLNYWGMGAVVYFMIFLFSFSVINRGKPLGRNLLETGRLASAILVLFEIGVYVFVPGFMDKWVIQAAYRTPLESFTNWDLLVLALAGLIVLHFLLTKTTNDGSAASSAPTTNSLRRSSLV